MEHSSRIAPNDPPSSLLAWIIWPMLISLLCAAIGVFLWMEDKTVTEENRIIENSQVAFLALATIIHATQCVRSGSGGTARLCHLVLSALAFSILIRESEISEFGAASVWEPVEMGIRAVAGLAWIGLAVAVWRIRVTLWALKAPILFSIPGLLTGACVFFYCASWFFDKSAVPIAPDVSQLWEELLQLSGTIFMFAGSLRRLKLLGASPEERLS